MNFVKIPVLFGAVCGLIACSEPTTDGAKNSVDIPPAHAKLVETIEEGRTAARANDTSAQSDAAKRLQAMKARPLDGMTNLVEAWQDASDATPPMRGRVQGPGYRVADLPAGATDSFKEILYGVELTRISVSGGESLSLDVLDEAGAPPLCEAQTVCAITPEVTARYEIVVRNSGEAGTYIVVID